MKPLQLKTLAYFENLSERAIDYLASNSEINPKMSRKFTEAEASKYLLCDRKTLRRYCEEIGIHPHIYAEDGIAWLIDLEEIYSIRDAMSPGTTLKKKFKPFVRSDKQRQHRLVIQNQNGGGAKTMTAITVATGLATEFHEQYKVLVVDMDPKSTLTSFQPSDSDRISVGDLFMLDPETESDYIEKVKASVSDTTIPNLKILPASQRDMDLDFHCHKLISEGCTPYSLYRRLDSILNALDDMFDIVIIDTPPSVNFSSLNAYFAASCVIFPLAANRNDRDSTLNYFTYISEMYKTLIKLDHRGYDFCRMLITNYEPSSDTHSEVFFNMSSIFPTDLYSEQFKKSEAVRKCAMEFNTIFDISSSCYNGTSTTHKTSVQNATVVITQILQEMKVLWDKQEKSSYEF